MTEVVDQTRDGEFVLSEPRCYPTLGAAINDARRGELRVPMAFSGKDLLAGSSIDESLLSSFTLGIHFDGFNGSGSSITVAGASCTGGWWNTGSIWKNRISSSWNGCYRLKHHDKPNRVGITESTIGGGRVHNLTVLNNRAESISYWSGWAARAPAVWQAQGR